MLPLLRFIQAVVHHTSKAPSAHDTTAAGRPATAVPAESTATPEGGGTAATRGPAGAQNEGESNSTPSEPHTAAPAAATEATAAGKSPYSARHH